MIGKLYRYGILLATFLMVLTGTGCTDTQTQVVPVDNDTAWNEWANQSSAQTREDLNRSQAAMQNDDYLALSTTGLALMNDTTVLIQENKNFTLSSYYAPAQAEYDLALRDLNTVGYYFHLIGEERGSDLLHWTYAADYENKTVDHLRNFSTMRNQSFILKPLPEKSN